MKQGTPQNRQTILSHDLRFYAQPYDIDASGFYFSDAAEYQAKVKACRNAYGYPVEEFEIQFIDGDDLDCRLFEALSINQATIIPFIEKLDEWSDEDKTKLIIAVGECGYSFDVQTGHADDIDVDIYEGTTLRELARQFVDEGLFGEIPDHLTHYIDYEAIARDLRADYTETHIGKTLCVYRCA